MFDKHFVRNLFINILLLLKHLLHLWWWVTRCWAHPGVWRFYLLV